ncbi:BnaC08g21970D [Brassica napus]|uniref:BnaC08g21970D protein n=1 Tax=Brassica napus TaxID=3708 RepID=A0A078FXA0_BRANA|nr:BnaC08g21970D [Brassica napus]
MVKSIIVIVAICLVSLPNPTVGSQKKPWPMPSDLANHNGKFGDSKVSWACSESQGYRTSLSHRSQEYRTSLSHRSQEYRTSLSHRSQEYRSSLVYLTFLLEKCLTGDKSKGSEKCFSQVFSSWADNDLSLDKECCEIVLNMDKKCNGHLHMMFKSHFFAPLLQYSCHIKHAKKN